ncbi:MAG TPA: hypothetical protein VMK65_12660 [Longimicrobiales bacterium]|nr:hypothetical protein [Longimicrobiales bacterium]
MRHSRSGHTLLALALLLPVPGAAQAQRLTPELLSGLTFRSVGPAVTGGRIHDVEALADRPSTLYVAAASGGLWKSTNGGTTWAPIFDDQPVSTFGDLAIAPSNPDVLYAGTGEQNNRQSTSWGNGVYRSDDAGTTWRHLGLDETRHIGRVLVHPSNPDIAYVAALGNLWKASPERGVYKTTDGGRSWDRVLFVDTLTGVVDMAMDPANPDVLYAAAYQRLRSAWGFNGGGPGSGIHKSTDGGRTWREVSEGIPAGDKGRIGLAAAPSRPGVVMAIIEHRGDGGTYRSEDGGERWVKVNDLNPRPMYYSHIIVDPTDDRTVYVLGQDFFKSRDGGRTFEEMPIQPTYDVGVHSDHHTLWIDPADPDHLYLAGDAGLHVSWDGGVTFARINNFSIGQFYDIALDAREPYRIYGGMQDNHSWVGPSATRSWIGILNDDWRQVGFGDGMHQQADPTDWRTAYVTAQNGNLHRLDAETGDRLPIAPIEPEGERYRFDWATPILLSPHDPSTLYLGGNRLFISRDRGLTWERTGDLTRAIDRDTLTLMGVRGADIRLSRNDGEATYGEITTIAESPLQAGVLWVGADDGSLQVSRDGGRTWAEVSGNLPGLPARTYVSRVEASRRGPGAAWATFDAHRDGDFAPWVYGTEDYGRTWRPLHAGLPSGSVNAIKEHPDNPSLLFLGTEHGVFASADAGASWAALGANLPTMPVDDIELHPSANDLVLGTHGRGIWILDDVAPLVEWTPSAGARLFSMRPATLFHYWKDTSYRGQAAYAGENPPEGALLSYVLPRDVERVTLTVRNAAGDVVRTLSGPTRGGVIHRVAWDLRHEPPADRRPERPTRALPVPPHPLAERGPFVSPGTYGVTLDADGARSSQSVLVEGDPLLALAQEDYERRETFLLDVQRLRDQAGAALADAEALRDVLPLGEGDAMALTRAMGPVRAAARDLSRIAGGFNSGGVQQPTLLPPPPPIVARKAEVERALRAALAELKTTLETARSARGENR